MDRKINPYRYPNSTVYTLIGLFLALRAQIYETIYQKAC